LTRLGFLGSFAQIGLIASGAYYVSICFPFLFAVYFFVQRYYLRTSRQMRFLDLEEKAPVYTQFLESLSGLATLRAFAWQKPLIEHNHVLVDKSQKPFYLMYMIQTWLSLVLDLITTALAIIVVATSVKMRNTVSVGFTGVSLTQIISFTSNLRFSILFWTHMETSIGAVARVKKFEAETENENVGGETEEPPADWPSEGEVRIEGLTVSYGYVVVSIRYLHLQISSVLSIPSTSEDTRKALDNVNLTIPAGGKLLVAGRTGSGKSTLLSSFFRLHPITSGRILIDGIDISTIPLSTLRSRLTSISEDSLFFTSSIRLNLDPYDASTDEQIETALSKMGLSDVIKKHGGLDAEFSEDMLSHGQKQVFCLARAILRPGKVVLLDEVSSSVDVETEVLIRKVLREEFVGRTVVCVAHRVEGLEGFDRHVRLEDGRDVEEQ
jgi:ABC-type multidrug transport system fused ATPase/permease subunit